MDLFKIASSLAAPDQKMRLRFGKVVSVQSNRTLTVTIAGSTDSVAGIRYLESVAPKPGAVVLLLTDGVDVFALAHLSADLMTLTPRAHRAADQTIPNNAWTEVTWEAVDGDPWGCWSGTNPTRLTAPIPGRYQAVLNVTFAQNATGNRGARIQDDAGVVLGRSLVAAVTGSNVSLCVTSMPFTLSTGGFITASVFQDSGGNLALSRPSTFNPALSLQYLG